MLFYYSLTLRWHKLKSAFMEEKNPPINTRDPCISRPSAAMALTKFVWYSRLSLRDIPVKLNECPISYLDISHGAYVPLSFYEQVPHLSYVAPAMIADVVCHCVVMSSTGIMIMFIWRVLVLNSNNAACKCYNRWWTLSRHCYSLTTAHDEELCPHGTLEERDKS